MRRISGLVVVAWCLWGRPAVAQDFRLDGLGLRPPDRVLVFVVRGEGVDTPTIAFEERARQVIEAHLHARVISVEEAFVRGGTDLQRKLADCRGDDRCYASLVGSIDASYLLVLAVNHVGDFTAIGSRFIDLYAAAALGNNVGTVPKGQDALSMLPDHIRASVPAEMWDPFGSLTISANLDGAEVSLNGRIIGLTPLGRITHLLPGRYQVSASKPGYTPVQEVAAIDRGGSATVDLALGAEASANLWWLWVIGGVVVVAGAATAIALLSRPETSFCSSADPSACD